MIYIDANIYINAAVNPEKTGSICRSILDAAEHGKLAAATSTLTFDEVLWKLRAVMDYGEAIQKVRAMTELPIRLLAVDAKTLFGALDLAAFYRVKPRDAIHASSMKQQGIVKICSSD